MIIVKVIGGLGNQMFQYACGRALSIQKNDQLYFDLSGCHSYRVHSFGLSGFRGDIAEAPWHVRTGSRLWSALRRIGIFPSHYFRLRGMAWIAEGSDLRFKQERLDFHGSAYLDGYWQSAAYFSNCEKSIRNDFLLIPALGKRLEERRQECGLGLDIAVSLHVRRGDYVADKSANAIHGVLGSAYYKAAVAHIAAALPHEGFRLFVFSDDIVWARNNLKFPYETTYVEPDKLYPQVDMHLMASCDHHIIANSSFSWWGAWLNASPSKIVVAPIKWFNASQYYSGDICPPSWVRL